MAKLFRLSILTPERAVFEGDVEYVQAPGTEGYFGVLADHAALVSALAPGTLTYRTPNGVELTSHHHGENVDAGKTLARGFRNYFWW